MKSLYIKNSLALIDFTARYHDTEEELLSSSDFRLFLKHFFAHLKDSNSELYDWLYLHGENEEEVLNYFNVLNHLDQYSDEIITCDTILSVHKDLTKDLLRNPEYEGKFRDTRVFIGNLHTQEINYMPPDAYKVPGLVDELLDWLNNSTDEIYPVIIAGILHYELVRIHPFVDGNGRTSRLMATLILSVHKFNINNYFTLDEYYNQDRQAYVDALHSADKNHDLTNWLEYFCCGVLYSINKIKSEVLKLSEITSKYDNTIQLTPNEISVLTLLEEKEHIQNKDIQKMLNITPQASYKIIRKLKNYRKRKAVTRLILLQLFL